MERAMFWILALMCVSLSASDGGQQRLKPSIPPIIFETEEKEDKARLQSVATVLSLFAHVSSLPQCAQVVDVDKRRREVGGVLENWVSRDVSGLVLDYEGSFADEPWVRFVKDVLEPYAKVPPGGTFAPTKFLSWLRVKHPAMYSKPGENDMSKLLLSSMKKMHGHTPFCYTLLEKCTSGRFCEESSNESVRIRHFNATLSLEEVLRNSNTFTRKTSSLNFSKLPAFLTFLCTQRASEFLNVSSRCTPALQQSTESTLYRLLGILYQNKPVRGVSYGVGAVNCPYSLLLREGDDWVADFEPGKLKLIPSDGVKEALPVAFKGHAYVVYEHMKTK